MRPTNSFWEYLHFSNENLTHLIVGLVYEMSNLISYLDKLTINHKFLQGFDAQKNVDKADR